MRADVNLVRERGGKTGYQDRDEEPELFKAIARAIEGERNGRSSFWKREKRTAGDKAVG
ncbi:MAG: hypothetical protein ACLTAF_01660 [Blautia coccoides]